MDSQSGKITTPQQKGQPQEVKLFLDGQRPGVAETILRVAIKSDVVVARVEHGAPGMRSGNDLMLQQQQNDEQRPVAIECRKDAQHAPHVKLRERDRYRSFRSPSATTW